MIEQDTVRLLRECDAGAKMGIDALTDVIGRVDSDSLRELLKDSKEEHERLAQEAQKQLDRFQDQGRAPSPLASAMTWLKTNMELMADGTDGKIADLMTDGCNMGVKSLSRYLNQYQAADEDSKALAQKLIGEEEALSQKIRPFL